MIHALNKAASSPQLLCFSHVHFEVQQWFIVQHPKKTQTHFNGSICIKQMHQNQAFTVPKDDSTQTINLQFYNLVGCAFYT